jgi:protein O-mannosyl-transferase
VSDTEHVTPLWPALGGRRQAAAAAALAILVLVAYGNGLWAGFSYDSRHLILDDPRVHAATGENVRLIFTQDYWWPKAVSGLYRPLVKLSYLLDWAILGSGDRPAGYHAVNLVLHWANAVLVFLLGLVTMRRPGAAFATAALFASHPIATEAVTNIVGRADLLAALAVLGGTLIWVRSRRERGPHAILWLAGLALASGLGVLAKESAAAVLGVIVVYELATGAPAPTWRAATTALARRVAPALAVVLPILLAVLLLRVRLYADLPTPLLPFVDNPEVGTDALTARLTALAVVGRYAGLLLWPWTLSCDYSYAQVPLARGAAEVARAFAAAAAGAAVITLAVRRRRTAPALPFWVGLSAVTLLPSANLVWPIGSIMAERFLYLPSAGFAACLALAGDALGRRRPRLVAALLAVVVGAYALRTVVRNRDWQDDLRLFSAAVLASPRSAKAHQQLAYALWAADAPDYPHIDVAIREGERALALMDAEPLPLTWRTSAVPAQLGAYYWIRGRKQSASEAEQRQWFERAVAVLAGAEAIDRAHNDEHHAREVARGRPPAEVIDVGNPEIYYYLGLAYLGLGRPGEARTALARMRRLAPADANAYWTTARAELADGAFDDAAVSLHEALTLNAGDREAWRALADLYARVDGGGCAIVREASAERLNTACPRARRDACAAHAGLAHAFADAGQAPLARRVEELGRQRWGCAGPEAPPHDANGG